MSAQPSYGDSVPREHAAQPPGAPPVCSKRTVDDVPVFHFQLEWQCQCLGDYKSGPSACCSPSALIIDPIAVNEASRKALLLCTMLLSEGLHGRTEYRWRFELELDGKLQLVTHRDREALWRRSRRTCRSVAVLLFACVASGERTEAR